MNKISHNVDIRVDKKYNVYDPFIMAHNVRQVYYVPYHYHISYIVQFQLFYVYFKL